MDTTPRWRFEAEALKPTGKYTAAYSETLREDNDYRNAYGNPVASNQYHQKYCDRLLQNLIVDGWELTGEKGPNWWNYKFRRELRS
ncbi:MAG: hypothetical protein ACYDER_05045 [Ktedonobacteraceae bacterium]